jgi:hypothetical protein
MSTANLAASPSEIPEITSFSVVVERIEGLVKGPVDLFGPARIPYTLGEDGSGWQGGGPDWATMESNAANVKQTLDALWSELDFDDWNGVFKYERLCPSSESRGLARVFMQSLGKAREYLPEMSDRLAKRDQEFAEVGLAYLLLEYITPLGDIARGIARLEELERRIAATETSATEMKRSTTQSAIGILNP